MKDKIITLKSGIDFYIIEEVDYKDKKYILGSKCDLIQDKISEEELNLFEISINNDDLVVNNVEDETAQIVTSMIMEKISNNN